MLIRRFYAGAAAMAAVPEGIIFPVTALFAAADRLKSRSPAISHRANSSRAVTFGLGDLRKAGSAKLACAADCNAPFRYTTQSDNGVRRLVHVPAAVPRDMRSPLASGSAVGDSDQKTAVELTAAARIREFLASRCEGRELNPYRSYPAGT